MRPEQIPYGVKDFRLIRTEGLYYVDKTAYIHQLEKTARFLFFVRPRRFGKSLFCEMLRCYYDVTEKKNFEMLFGGLAIGKDPTPSANRFVVVPFDFSRVGGSTNIEACAENFERYMNYTLDSVIQNHVDLFRDSPTVMATFLKPGAFEKYNAIAEAAHALGYGIYVIVDEYDNFTNDIVSVYGKDPYREITHGTGFYRGWFKTFKATCDRIFMTGVSPVTMDDLTSGFNIAQNITLETDFNAMIGFTTEETRQIFADFLGAGKFADGLDTHLGTVKRWYDSYCFSKEKIGEETLYNCDMVLYYLSKLVATGKPPMNLIDGNIRSDWNKLNAILAAQRHAETYEGVLPLTEELSDQGEVSFDLVESFPIDKIFEPRNFKSLYYYYGIVTMAGIRQGNVMFGVPNECVRRQIFDYLRDQYESRPNPVDFSDYIEKFDAFAWDGEWKGLLTYLAEKYRDNGSPRDGIEGEARINGYIRAYLTMKSVYMVKPEMAHPLGFSDYALFPDFMLPESYQPQHSYLIELKHAKAEASDAELAHNHAEAVEQLRRYAADPHVVQHAGTTPVHYICYEFKGRDLVHLEEVVL